MKNITIIAAIGKNNELGKNNDLIWHLPEDLTFFKEQTINKPIVMGKNTLDSLPKLLPKRLHLVLTHQEVEQNEQVKIFHNNDDLLNYIKDLDTEVMIIGGSQIYKQFINIATKMILTEIDDTCADADVFFPSFSKDEWSREELCHHREGDITYKHVLYRKNNC